jgi:hypothetical protein
MGPTPRDASEWYSMASHPMSTRVRGSSSCPSSGRSRIGNSSREPRGISSCLPMWLRLSRRNDTTRLVLTTLRASQSPSTQGNLGLTSRGCPSPNPSGLCRLSGKTIGVEQKSPRSRMRTLPCVRALRVQRTVRQRDTASCIWAIPSGSMSSWQSSWARSLLTS